MTGKNITLKQEITKLKESIEQLVWDLRQLPEKRSTRKGWIAGMGIAAVSTGLAAEWSPETLVSWCLIGTLAEVVGAVVGEWVERKGGKWLEDRSRATLLTEIQGKREALLEAEISLLQEEALKEKKNFILNPRFSGEDENIYGKPSSALFLTKIRDLENTMREKSPEKIKLKILNLSDIDLRGKDLKELLSVALKVFDIETLILRNNHLRDDEIQYLKEILLRDKAAVSRLKKLDVSRNNLTGKSLETIQKMARDLDLEALDLSHNAQLGSLFKKDSERGESVFVAGSADALGKFFRAMPIEMPCLKFLNLRHIGLVTLYDGMNPVEELHQALKRAPFLKGVDLRDNPCLASSSLSLIQEQIKKNLAARKLHFEESHAFLTSETKLALMKRNRLFETLGRKQPALVDLLQYLRDKKEIPSEIVRSLFQQADIKEMSSDFHPMKRLSQVLKKALFRGQIVLSKHDNLRYTMLSHIQEGEEKSLTVKELRFNEADAVVALEIKPAGMEHNSLFEVVDTGEPTAVTTLPERLLVEEENTFNDNATSMLQENLEERIALKREISELEAKITQLIEDLYQFPVRAPGTYATRGGRIGGVGMAVLGIGLAIVWGPVALFALGLTAMIAGVAAAITGRWIGRKGGEWLENRPSKKINNAIRIKKEALFDMKLKHLQQKDVEIEPNFVLNPRFPGEEKTIHGELSSTFYVKGMQKLEAKMKEKGVEKIQVKILNLSDIGLKGADLEALLSVTLKIFNVETLLLRNNGFGDEGISRLNRLIFRDRKAVSGLKKLDVSGNDLTGSSLGAIQEIVSGLDVDGLNLSNNEYLGSLFEKEIMNKKGKLIPSAMEPLTQFIDAIPIKMPSLKYLWLDNVGLTMLDQPKKNSERGLEPITALRQLLRKAPLLQYVDLGCNSLLQEGGLSIIQEGVKENITLKRNKKEKGLRFDRTNEKIASEIEEELSRHEALFQDLSADQPVLVALLNAKRCNQLPQVCHSFLSQYKLGGKDGNEKLQTLHFSDEHIGEILEALMLKRKKEGKNLEVAISEKEVIAYMKSSYLSKEKKSADNSMQQMTEADLFSSTSENEETSDKQITHRFDTAKSRRSPSTPENDTKKGPRPFLT